MTHLQESVRRRERKILAQSNIMFSKRLPKMLLPGKWEVWDGSEKSLSANENDRLVKQF